jgi:hypothetical protein
LKENKEEQTMPDYQPTPVNEDELDWENGAENENEGGTDNEPA